MIFRFVFSILIITFLIFVIFLLQCPICLLPIFRSATSKCCLLENCFHVFCAECLLALRKSDPNGRPCPVCHVDSLRVIVTGKVVEEKKKKSLFSAHPRSAKKSGAFRIATPALPTPFTSHLYPKTEENAIPPNANTLARFQCPRITIRGDCDFVKLPAVCPFSHRPLGPTLDVDFCAAFLLDGCDNPRYLFDGHVYCENIHHDGLFRVHLSEPELQQWLAIEEASNIFYC